MKTVLFLMAAAGCLSATVVHSARVRLYWKARHFPRLFASLSMALAIPGWAVCAALIAWPNRWPWVNWVVLSIGAGFSWFMAVAIWRVGVHEAHGPKKERQAAALDELNQARAVAARRKELGLPPGKGRG